MRDDFRRLAHAGLTFNAPLSEERASALVSALPISPGHHVLDLGCGWGELLLRILAAHPATTGTGRRHRQGGARPGRAGGDAPRPARAGRVRRGARRDVRRRRRHRRLRRLLACVRRHRRRARLAAAERRLRAAGCSSATASGRPSRRPRRSRRSASCPRPRRAPGSHSGGRLPDRARRGVRPRRVGRVRIGLAVGSRDARPTPRRWRSPRERRREYEDGYREAIGFSWLVLAPV